MITTQDYSVAWDNYIWNSWNIPQSYKENRVVDPVNHKITYTLRIHRSLLP